MTNQIESLRPRVRNLQQHAAGPAGTNAPAGTNPAALAPGAATPGAPTPGATAPGATAPGATAPGATTAGTNEETIAIAPTHPAAPEEMIAPGMIDFRAVDVSQVLQLYAEWVNRTVLKPATLPAPTITLRSQTPLTRREAVQALDAVLALNGIAMINVGDKFVKAVPQPTANQEGAPFSKLTARELPDMGQYVTHIVQLKYLKPSEVMPVLQPFAKLPNSILPVETSQILVLRDDAENVKRMLEMIEKIDVVTPAEYTNEVIMIKYALASDIASALNSLSSGGGGTTVGTGSRTGATAPRSAFGGSRSGSGYGSGYGGGLGSSYGSQTGYGGTSFGGGFSPQAVTTPYAGGAPGAAGGSSFTQRLQNIINKAQGTGEIQVLGQTKIIADERTNALLVYASREDMKTIKDIVAKLDVVLAQVLIEAVIVEVSLNKNQQIGVSYLEQQPHPQNTYFSGRGAILNPQAPVLTPNSFQILTNGVGGLAGGFNYLARFGGDLDVTLSAIAAGSHAKVLQRPRIQTSHAVPASLFVGQSRPYPTGSYYGGGAYGGYSSIQQLQIGVSLDVTPLINPDGLVVMDIHSKIDSVTGSVSIANVGDVPITSDKEAQAKVAVKDKDTIILGGLIETDKSDSNSGVPFLKDLPVLGVLFRSSTSDATRSELIVLIRPTVLPTPEIAALAATADRRNMPNIRTTEQEIQYEDESRNQKADKLMQERAYEHEHQQ
jgi:general secretion pathway protein D